MAARVERSLMAILFLMVWDGFLMIGEGLGLEGRAQRKFADIAWCMSAALLVLWLVAMLALSPAVLK